MSHKASESARLQYEELFREWESHPVTKKLKERLAFEIQERKDAWANGEMVASFAHEQFVREAVAKGFISGCELVLSLEAKDLESHE